MKIIISPAKKMNVDTDSLPVSGLPKFLEDTRELCTAMQQLSYREAKELWGCNDKLAELNFRRFEEMNLEERLTPAVISYEGLQYRHMAPIIFTEQELQYIDAHLRILSGFYGVLSPFDGVVPYRLEMQARLSVEGKKDLYDFWGDRLCRTVLGDDHTVINLASKEYSAAVERHLSPQDSFITCVFGELQAGKIRQKGTLAKMARGEMVRFMAQNHITEIRELKEFDALGYHYREEYSSDKELVFLIG